ncbi:hypothetical protein L6452_36658 [Arctium lappa]|uniref:Uncharacterized protein n=1 Tax=Arctium lappa TaxID=4217 RepID=A0ACB8YB18_ARCLA|nr:hypothetical protein L6452_36658 [Arctium lappa]
MVSTRSLSTRSLALLCKVFYSNVQVFERRKLGLPVKPIFDLFILKLKFKSPVLIFEAETTLPHLSSAHQVLASPTPTETNFLFLFL